MHKKNHNSVSKTNCSCNFVSYQVDLLVKMFFIIKIVGLVSGADPVIFITKTVVSKTCLCSEHVNMNFILL